MESLLERSVTRKSRKDRRKYRVGSHAKTATARGAFKGPEAPQSLPRQATATKPQAMPALREEQLSNAKTELKHIGAIGAILLAALIVLALILR